MDLSDYTKISRRDGKLVIEIPEARILESVTELLYHGAAVRDAQRLLDHVATHLTSRHHTASGRKESTLHQLIGETLAEAAHAGAGLEWRDPAKHDTSSE